jgi:UDP-N-acetylmuramoyl-L-alanyl-D-glutamate--2,6-diaminopimelate ligase
MAMPVDKAPKRLSDLLTGLRVLDVTGGPEAFVREVAYDSRRIEGGDLFVAVRGTRQDGGAFVEDALRRGAAVIVSEDPPPPRSSAIWVQVPSSREALAGLAASYYDHPSRRMRILGITGTNGKTTTTLLVESILKRAGHVVGVLGTLAYRWKDRVLKAPMTTPESLDLQRLLHDMLQDGVTHVVMEVSSHALALGRVRGTAFSAGLFTNLSQDHLDFHQDMESYYRSKSILFREYLGDRDEPGVAVINRDDPYGFRLMEVTGAEVWSYSVERRDARVWVRSADLSPGGISAELVTSDGPLRLRSPLIGRLNLYNLVGAATLAMALEVPRPAIVDGLADVARVDGRLERVAIPESAGFEVIVDYAHTPDAMVKALACLREMTRGRLLVVFGCGGDRDRSKRPLMGEAAARLGDLVIVTSDNPRTEAPERIIEEIVKGVRSARMPLLDLSRPAGSKQGYAVVEDRREAIGKALSWAQPGDVVFIGGKGHETYQIVGSEVLPFDDRKVVREYFESQGERGARSR